MSTVVSSLGYFSGKTLGRRLGRGVGARARMAGEMGTTGTFGVGLELEPRRNGRPLGADVGTIKKNWVRGASVIGWVAQSSL